MAQALDIDHCDLEIKTNCSSHHTELNGLDRLIVRRGQSFLITLHLKAGSGPYTPGATDFSLTAETGPLPRTESGTKVTFGLNGATSGTDWSASAVTGPVGNTVSVSISSSPNAPIGRYSLTLDQGGKITSLGEFILLFNAWCPKDAVYMRNEEKRREYILNQHGLIYKGTAKRIKGYPWNFGQFEAGVLDICLKILDANPKYVSDADQDVSGRRNPVYVTRVLSAMINHFDDRGVLVGNWSGDYEDGYSPSHWIGSEEILRQWDQSGPVRYGQCWVFAAVECTASRALGIPCRVVTNFGSAHDGNANLVIERLYNEDGEIIDGDDSIWNFHVWVDSWMTRPDLGPGFDGWQASDPTPQERSDGVFCCGPISLHAIREGEMTKKYDAPFVFSEVNADVVELVQLSNGQTYKFSTSTKSVGNCISTKSVGEDLRHDITHQYKYPEGSEEERRVYEKAQHHNKLLQKGEEPGIHLKVKLAENMMVGADFEVNAILKNNYAETKTFTMLMFARAVTYDGKRGANCGYASDKIQLAGGEETRMPLKLEYAEYGSAVTSDKLIEIQAFAMDKETMEYSKAEKTIVLDEPEIEIKLMEESTVHQPTTVKVCLVNPLPEPLEDCCFTLEGVGLTQGKPIIHKVGTVKPLQEARAKVQFTPSASGSTVLLVNFESDKLSGIKGFLNVMVNE